MLINYRLWPNAVAKQPNGERDSQKCVSALIALQVTSNDRQLILVP